MSRNAAVGDLAGLVLAAGSGIRFGGAKQLAWLGEASLLERAVRLTLEACPRGVTVVTGAHAQPVRAALARLPVKIVHNAQWQSGLASSLRSGIGALKGARACLVMLCDQPRIDALDLQRLVAAWSATPERAAAARYAGALGVPAIFPMSSWPALRQLEGDRGARALLAALNDVAAVAMPHALEDVDTPADLAAAQPRREQT